MEKMVYLILRLLGKMGPENTRRDKSWKVSHLRKFMLPYKIEDLVFFPCQILLLSFLFPTTLFSDMFSNKNRPVTRLALWQQTRCIVILLNLAKRGRNFSEI